MVGFLMAGFETTSSTLNLCLYMMAKHPDELKKLQAEVDEHFKNTEVCSRLTFICETNFVRLTFVRL